MNRAASASAQILSVCLLLLATGGSASLVFAGEQASDAKATQEADAILAERFKDGLPGAAAIVVRDGRVIFRKA
jgi:CubicO group peptidase (beta-lactamase class C family)